MERQITSGTKILLDPASDTIDGTTPLFAINWFNTRVLWLYNLYNLIASRSVFKIGAKVFFKGRVSRTLLGSPERARQMLLVVNYPNGERLLDMLASRFFQVTSLLRMAAVKDFSFLLNRRVDGPTLLATRTPEFDSSKRWLVHHYSSATPLESEAAHINELLAGTQVSLHFASAVSYTHLTLPTKRIV